MSSSGAPRIGLVGCGRWGSLILRDLRQLGATVDVVVRRPDRDDARRLEEQGANLVSSSVADLAGVDGVVVATPTISHAEVVDEVLGLGVPTFVEKPVTSDPASALGLAEAAPDRLFVMDKWRYHPGIGLLRDLLASGRLGSLEALRTVRVQWQHPHSDVDCAWILLPHDLSIALEVVGEVPTPTSATAWTRDDTLAGLFGTLRFTDGAWMHVEVGVTATTANRRIEVMGSEATAVLAGGWEQEVLVQSAGVDGSIVEERVPATGELPLMAELRCFLEHLRGGPAPRSSASEGATIVAAIEHLRRLGGLGS
jgi:predicted dehydrogenase